MNKYNKIGFVNGSAPPLNAENLNHMDEGIEQVTDGAITLETEITTARGECDTLGERLDGLVPDEQGFINTYNLADGAITTPIIEDGAVTKTKLSSDLNTLENYGITDAYTKDDIKCLLAKKLDFMPFDSEPKQNSPCYLTSGTVYNALLKNESLTNKVNSALEIKDRTVNYPTIKYLDDYFVTANQAIKSYEKQSNRVTDISKTIVDKSFAYPSVKYLESYLDEHYYAKNNLYTSDLIDVKLQTKYDSSNIESGISTLTPYSSQTDKSKSAVCTYKKVGDTLLATVTITLNAGTLGANSTLHFIDLPFRHNSDTPVYFTGISSKGGVFKGVVPKTSTWLSIMSTITQTYTFTDGEQLNFSLMYKI